jgi:hypothetical protein
VVKVALGSGANPPTRVGAVTLNAREIYLKSAMLDAANGYAYFANYGRAWSVVMVSMII